MKILPFALSLTVLAGLGQAQQDPPAPLVPPAAGGEAAATPRGPATLLRLRDGSVRWGWITEHDPEGIRFESLAHGGELRLEWRFLDPGMEEELRNAYGYVDVVSEELMIEVDRLILSDGREVLGKILDSEDSKNFLVLVEGNTLAIPKYRVVSRTGGQFVPILDVYSRQDVYEDHLTSLVPEDPGSQLDLAELCERILDFQNAVVHYSAAVELLEAGTAPADAREMELSSVQFALERSQEKAKQQAQIDYLRETDVLRKRGYFDKALEQLAGFSIAFPGSPLVEDAQKKLVRTEELRDEAARKLVQRRWTYWAKRLARERGKELPFEQAQSYASGQMTQDIQKLVFADLQKNISKLLPEEAVLDYWATRRKLRYTTASFGLATWLLGKDRARAGGEDKEKDAQRDQETALDRERAAFEEKMKRFLENQQRAARARGGADDAEEASQHWLTMSSSARGSWLFAYYVEFGGAYELRGHPYTPNCKFCGGTGGREVVAIGGGGSNRESGGSRGRGGSGRNQVTSGMRVVECPTCHGAGVTRRVYFR